MKLERRIQDLKIGAIYNLGEVVGSKYKLCVDLLNPEYQGFTYCVMPINRDAYLVIPYNVIVHKGTEFLNMN